MFVIKIFLYLLLFVFFFLFGSGVIIVREWDFGIEGIGVRVEDE